MDGSLSNMPGPQILNDSSPKAVAGLFIELFLRVCVFSCLCLC